MALTYKEIGTGSSSGSMGPPGPTGPQGPAGEGTYSNGVTLDFGDMPIAEKSFTIVDSNVTPYSMVLGTMRVDPATKAADEDEMDYVRLTYTPYLGSFTVLARGSTGYLAGKYYFNYALL